MIDDQMSTLLSAAMVEIGRDLDDRAAESQAAWEAWVAEPAYLRRGRMHEGPPLDAARRADAAAVDAHARNRLRWVTARLYVVPMAMLAGVVDAGTLEIAARRGSHVAIVSLDIGMA